MSKKILICDDEDGVRESLKALLSDHFNLVMTDSGQQCLDTLNTNKDKIAAILLDIKMPKMSGLDVLAEIKHKFPKLPVIMITGYNAVEPVAASAARGASAYIIKPFDGQDIAGIIKKFLK